MDDRNASNEAERRALFMRLPLSDAYHMTVEAGRRVTAELVPLLDSDNPLRGAALDEILVIRNSRRQLLLLDNAQLYGVLLTLEGRARQIRANGWTPPPANGVGA